METLEDYLEALASAAPTPGGGSAATIVGAMAASLVAMVSRITLASPKFQTHAAHAEKLVGAADGMRAAFLSARREDERAYGAVVAAMARPRSTDAEKSERTSRVQATLGEAAAAPLGACQLALSVLTLTVHAQTWNNRNLMSDLECAAFFARASIEASAANVRVNHRYMTDTELVGAQERALADIELAFARFFTAFEKRFASEAELSRTPDSSDAS